MTNMIDDPNFNGEYFLYSFIENHIKSIFDVGCRDDSLFKNFGGTVHYFEPSIDSIEKLKKQLNYNKKSYYNNIALSDKTGNFYYYPKYQSLHNRIKSCNIDDDENKQLISAMTGFDYVKNNNINEIDFLKIDVEGHEFSVIKGFKESISCVNVIQFEYGGTFIDTGIKLIDIKNYLNGIFDDFYYLKPTSITKITDFTDHYMYCNIVCFNKKYDFNYYKDMIHV